MFIDNIISIMAETIKFISKYANNICESYFILGMYLFLIFDFYHFFFYIYLPIVYYLYYLPIIIQDPSSI